MKIVRSLFAILLFLVALLVIAILASPLWLGPAIRSVANAVAPDRLGTGFSLGECDVNMYSGSLHVGALTVENPPPYAPKECVRIGSFDVTVDPGSLMTDVIGVRKIVLRDAFVAVAWAGTRDNFSAIAANVRKDAKTGTPEAGKKADRTATPSKTETPSAGGREQTEPKKVMIDRIELEGVTVSLGGLPVPLPTIVLTDVGRTQGGITWEVAWQEIINRIRSKTGIDDLRKLGTKGLATGLKELEKAGVKSLETMNSQQLKAVGDSLKEQGKDLGKTFEGKGKDLGNSVKEAFGAGGEGATKAGKALLKGLLGN